MLLTLILYNIEILLMGVCKKLEKLLDAIQFLQNSHIMEIKSVLMFVKYRFGDV